ncbi:MAG: hypothetical protein AB1505_03975 [Candidatus Latescibacterota bacterium]
MAEFVVGTSAGEQADSALLREAGFGWIRQGFPFPLAEGLGGRPSPQYAQARAAAQAWIERGFRVMGITPLVGFEAVTFTDEGSTSAWQGRTPPWMGELTGEEFARNYQRVCAFLARDLQGMVPLWQIGNEWDAPAFSGPLGLRRACELVFHAARGLKEADASLTVGTNAAGISKSYYFHGRLYADPRGGDLDYCGVDQYFGSWQPGGPDTWDAHIWELAEITGRPLLINEWGYASEGEVMDETEKELSLLHGAYYSGCRFRRWPFQWDEGHTPEVQAAYIRRALEVFGGHRERILGLLFYRWEDQQICWCGQADCPAQTRWGLVDPAGRPKPGFHAFREGIRQHFPG